MKKEIIKTQKMIVRYCDDCKKGPGKYSCGFCGKDLCKYCVHTDWDGCDGDYPDRWCKRCWDATLIMREEHAAIQKIHNLDWDKLEEKENEIKEKINGNN